MFVSLSEQLIEPYVREAVPCFDPLSALIVTRHVDVYCKVTRFPFTETVPLPVYTVPP